MLGGLASRQVLPIIPWAGVKSSVGPQAPPGAQGPAGAQTKFLP